MCCELDSPGGDRDPVGAACPALFHPACVCLQLLALLSALTAAVLPPRGSSAGMTSVAGPILEPALGQSGVGTGGCDASGRGGW